MLDLRTRHWAALLFLAASAAACGKSPYTDDPLPPPPIPPKSPAPKPSWETTYSVKMTFVGGDDDFKKAYCELKLMPADGASALEIDCAHLPHPVDVTFEGATQSNESGDSEYDTFKFKGDFNKRLSAVPLDALKEKNNVKFQLPISVTFAFGGHESMTVSPPALWVFDDVYQTWAGKAVSFTDGTRADDGKKSALLIHEGYSGHELVGEGTLLDDLDFIAVQRDLPDPAVSCFGGRLVYRTEADVTLYDRRYGTAVDTHHFSNKAAGCPSQAIVSDITQYQSGIDSKQIAAWLKTRIKK